MNLNEDATLSECLLYYIKEGVTKVGSPEANLPQDIQLVGAHIQSEHCHFVNSSGVVKLLPKPGAICFINGKKVFYCPQMTAIHVRIFCWQSADSKAGSFSQITKSLVISGGTRQQSGS